MKIKVIDSLGYQMDTIGQTHDLLDGKIIINHFGEKLYGLTGIIEVSLLKLTDKQKTHTGTTDFFVYQIN